MGRPLIATDVAGCREIVCNPENGFLIVPRNAQDLADKMQKFASLAPASQINMGLRSREIAEEKFGEKIIIEKYLAFLETDQARLAE